MKSITKNSPPIEAIDLFCGAGGLSHGLSARGILVKAGIDIDPHCEYAFTANHKKAKFLLKDISKVTGEELTKFWSKKSIRLLAGCAPCQPFSSYANTKTNTDSEKWGLLYEFARLIKETTPDLVTMENVPRLAHEMPFAEFLEVLRSLKYNVAHGVLNAADYGAAQSRKRIVLIASRIGAVSLPEPTHPGKEKWVSVQKKIGKLLPLKAGETDPDDPLHTASALSPLNLKRIRASSQGGTWRDWPKSLVAECHKKESGKHSAGVYGRMEWNKPAPTMTTLCNGYGNGRFGHPEQDRAISLREAALFQSFPKNYKFVKPGSLVQTRPIAKLIGNAVPPKLGEAVAKSLLNAIPA